MKKFFAALLVLSLSCGREPPLIDAYPEEAADASIPAADETAPPPRELWCTPRCVGPDAVCFFNDNGEEAWRVVNFEQCTAQTEDAGTLEVPDAGCAKHRKARGHGKGLVKSCQK